MASINGIRLRAIKTFEGKNGMGYQANIYLAERKIGSVLNSGDGGETDVTIWHRETDFMRRVKEYFNGSYEPGEIPIEDSDNFLPGLFIDSLLNVSEAHKLFKKAVKKMSRTLGGSPEYDNVHVRYVIMNVISDYYGPYEENAYTGLVVTDEQLWVLKDRIDYDKMIVFEKEEDFEITEYTMRL